MYYVITKIILYAVFKIVTKVPTLGPKKVANRIIAKTQTVFIHGGFIFY